jgi:sugar O-acyltransferase (sialic acid O-acetyltransferase NeuD family)
MRILLIGAGGHAQVVADALLRAREAGHDVQPVGYLDDNPNLISQQRLGLPILGPLHAVATIPHDELIIAIGNNWVRKSLYLELQAQGYRFATVCHPRAILAPDIKLGPGTVVFGGVVVNTGSIIGANVILNTGCTVDHHNHISDHVHLAPGTHLGGDVEVGEGTLVGIGATIMSQRTVGKWSTVGAGAVVHRNLPERVTAIGVPAKIKESLTLKGERLHDSYRTVGQRAYAG